MKRSILPWLLLLALMMLCSGCGEADLSAYENTEITITGLTEEEFTITVGELAEMESVSQHVVATTQKASDATIEGPLLSTLMAQYGKVPSDYFMVRVSATDGFSKKFTGADCETAVLAVSRDGKALDEDYLPLHFVIPEKSSGDWVRKVCKIEFVTE